MRTIRINQYYGRVDVRLYDTKLEKNVAVIETGHLEDYLTKKVGKSKLEKTKGNILPRITL